MSTYKQNLKRKHKKLKKHHKSWTSALRKCPQKRGICLKLIKESPKKPNSAKRSVAKIKLSTGRSLRAQIPGEGHRLIRFNRVLIRGGRTRDLPGIRYRVIRGKYDCNPVIERRKGVSKYGMKSNVIVAMTEKLLSKALD